MKNSTDFRLHAFGTDHGLADDDQRHLLALMGEAKPAWSKEVEQKFLDAIIEAITLHRRRAAHPELTPAQLKGHFQAAARAGTILLSALEDVPDHAWAFADMRVLRATPESPDGRVELTSGLAQAVQLHLKRLIDNLAVDAASVTVGKHVQPSATASRNLCQAVAAAHLSILDVAPRAAWFVPFMEAVGKCSGLKIGRPVVLAAIKSLTDQSV